MNSKSFNDLVSLLREEMGKLISRNSPGYGATNPYYARSKRENLGTPAFQDAENDSSEDEKKKRPVKISRVFTA